LNHHDTGALRLLSYIAHTPRSVIAGEFSMCHEYCLSPMCYSCMNIPCFAVIFYFYTLFFLLFILYFLLMNTKDFPRLLTVTSNTSGRELLPRSCGVGRASIGDKLQIRSARTSTTSAGQFSICHGYCLFCCDFLLLHSLFLSVLCFYRRILKICLLC
jgi:hypothetical protein